MDQARYYPGIFDVSQLAMQLASNLQLRAYQAQWFGSGNQMMVQVRKGSEAAKIFGAQAAVTIMLTQHPTGLLATIGQQRWVDKAVAAGVGAFFLWPLLIPAAVGAVRQSNLPNEVLTLLDTLVLQQNPMAYPQPVPVFLMPQVQMVYQNPPGGSTMTTPQQFCPACHQPNNTGASFCQHCGTPLDNSAASQAPTMVASVPPVTPPPAPQPPPAPPKPQPAKQTAPPTTRVSRTAMPTERVTSPEPVGPTGIFTLPSGRRVPMVTKEAIVGRGNPDGTDPVEVDMTTEAESSTVSRRHARITRANGGFEIEDLNSANQTLLNNEQLTPGRRYALRKGDVVEFGKVKCTFSVQGK
jgi:hypothetical protein